MKIISNEFFWLESWETNKEYNVEAGFDNHALLKGFMLNNIYSDLEQLPGIEFFLEISKLKPKLYAENKMTYGELVCYIENKRYKAIYYYDKNCYMITDDTDTIIKRIGSYE